jgi:outer membrane protein
VLDQEQELLDAQTNRVASEVDRYVAVYEVLDAIGLLTADHLGLGVPTYDPAAYYNAVKDAPGTLVSPEGKRLDRVIKALGKQ